MAKRWHTCISKIRSEYTFDTLKLSTSLIATALTLKTMPSVGIYSLLGFFEAKKDYAYTLTVLQAASPYNFSHLLRLKKGQ